MLTLPLQKALRFMYSMGQYATKASRLGFGDKDYKNMSLVDSGVLETSIVLKPSEEWKAYQELSVISSSYCSGLSIMPDDGTAIPKYSAWDLKDPSSTEGYSHIFNKAREDRHNGGGKSAMDQAIKALESARSGKKIEFEKGDKENKEE